MSRFSRYLMSGSVMGLFAATTLAAAPAFPPGNAKDVGLFYPGQSSWEWTLTQTDHPGADKFREGKDCAACHVGDEKNMGALLVGGKKNEPNPIPGKPGMINAKVQFAHDAQNLYVHIEFAEGNQPDAKMDDKFATKVAMMIEDGGVPEVTRGGCFAMCHDDSAGMPSAAGNATRTLYLNKTRAKLSRQGGGDALKPADELAKLKATNYLVEYWEAGLNPGSAPVANQGIIFDKREEVKPVAVTAEASNSGGTWSVTLTRRLNAGSGIVIQPGKRYTVAFAIHSGHAAKRFHYVSFERSLVLDQGTADFIAK